MAVRTYGKVVYDADQKRWSIVECETHVRIKLKSIFAKVPKNDPPPYYFPNTTENCTDLSWFIQRYPMDISGADKQRLNKQTKLHADLINQMERVLLPEYTPGEIILKDPFKARYYQLSAIDIFDIQKRMLLGDEMGLGKTLTAILGMFNKKRLPAIVVVKTHLQLQWRKDGIEKFTNLTAHCIDGTKPYDLPKADVYIIKYSCLSGWNDLFSTGFFKYAVFDEVHELRTGSASDKGCAARVLSDNVDYVMGLGATPIYNYGIEIWNIMQIIKPGCLGTMDEFAREWTHWNGKGIVIDPKALGTYMRENFLLLRRTREDVKMEVPVINQIVQYVDYDEAVVDSSLELAKQLAMSVLTGSFEERGQAAREFDMKLRQVTGISKAKKVAAYTKIILEAGEPVLLVAWHREVYQILLKELAAYRPALYTGSESASQKQRSLDEFKMGRTPLLIMSLRSGDGIDGLQDICSHVVYGELDYSPKVHEQIAGRLDRPGQTQQVTKHFVVTEWGSDPPIIDMLAIKSSQSHGIIDPLKSIGDTYTDEGRVKKMAMAFLEAENPGTLANTG